MCNVFVHVPGFDFTAHPNKDQYQQYLQQWQTYEKQMEQKRADIQQRKEAAKKQMKEQEKAAAKGGGFNTGMMQQGFGAGPMYGAPPPPNMGGPSGPNMGGLGPNMGEAGGPNMRPPGPNMGGPRGPPGGFGGPRPMGGPMPRGPPPMDGQRPFGPRGEAGFHGPRGEMGDRGRGRGHFNNRGRGGFGNMGRGQDIQDTVMEDADSGLALDDVSADDNNTLLEKLYNDERTNKFILNQLTDEGKDILNQLGFEGRVFLLKFPYMNPAQLNTMVKFVNTLGDESKRLHKMGNFNPMVISRMQHDVINEMKRINVNINALLAKRGRGGINRGRGRGDNFGRGRGGNFQGNQFGSEQDQQQTGFGGDSSGGGNRPGGGGKGPVSLLDLNFDGGPQAMGKNDQQGDESFDGSQGNNQRY